LNFLLFPVSIFSFPVIDLCRCSVLQSLVRTFVVVEQEVACQLLARFPYRPVFVQVDFLALHRPPVNRRVILYQFSARKVYHLRGGEVIGYPVEGKGDSLMIPREALMDVRSLAKQGYSRRQIAEKTGLHLLCNGPLKGGSHMARERLGIIKVREVLRLGYDHGLGNQ